MATPPDSIDTLVVGNGPAGISVSLALSGWWPSYRGRHPDGVLHARLTGDGPPLLERDPKGLCESLSGRGKNPMGTLFDALLHPGADAGRPGPSCLALERREERAVPHRVVGSGPPGGSWHRMPPTMLSLSPGYWMELPGWPLFEWARSRGRWLDPGARLPRSHVATYYQDYVDHMGLAENFVTDMKVTGAIRDGQGWAVEAHGPEGAVRMACNRLVVAGGMFDRPKWLKIDGEELPFVTHRTPEDGDGPLLVVGSGLSAADAVLMARHAGRDVTHASIDDPEATPMAGLAPEIYPEYRELFEAMQGASGGGYEPLLRTRLAEVRPDGACRLETPEGEIVRTFSQVAVLIGSMPDLSFLPAASRGDGERIQVDPYTFRTDTPGLYAVGPLVGDNFVRFIPGHAFGVARDVALAGSVSGPVG